MAIDSDIPRRLIWWPAQDAAADDLTARTFEKSWLARRGDAYDLQPAIMRELPNMSPFGAASLPSNAMIGWTIGFVLAVLGFAILQFRKRAL